MRLTFLGATMMVTGSSFLIEANDRKILVDCGLFQGSKTMEAMNRRDFLVEPSSIDCVLLTHAHIDHSGLLPKLCKAGFKGTIYATKVTAELCSIMLPDSGHIQEFEAEIANRKGQRAGKKIVEPLYTIDDAYKCVQHFSPVVYDTEIMLYTDIKIVFRDAGHILGSSMIEVFITENNKTTKLLFSGDIGQPNQPIIKDPELIDEADYIIMESTYGDRIHEHYDKEDRLAEIINEIVNRGGNLIIPSFAVGRTQTILYYLHKLFKASKIPDVPVIIDSPLAISATNIFMKNTQEYDSEAYDMLYKQHDNPLNMPHLVFSKTADESKAINNLTEPAIIISASGMADAGRVLHHLKHNLWRPESGVLFVGYQAQGSLGRRLLDGAKRVKVVGEEISVKATIYNMDGFSAHADREQMLTWLANFKKKPENVFIVHGEHDMSYPFSQTLQERMAFGSYIPRYGDIAVIDGSKWHVEQADIERVIPGASQLQEALKSFEREYLDYRKQLEQLLEKDDSKLPELLKKISKIQTFIRKNVDDL